jgi:hypothetical protein
MTMAAVVTATAAKTNKPLKTKRCSGRREAATMAGSEAAGDNDNKRDSDVAMVTAADNDSNSNSGSGGDDDNGSGGESDGSKKLTIN